MSKEKELLDSLQRGKVDDFFRLLEEVKLDDCADDEGQTAAHFAAMHGNEIFLRELIARGASTNSEDNSGYTPLQAMVVYVLDEGLLFNDRYIETATLLIQNGANTDELEKIRSDGDDDPDLDFIISTIVDSVTTSTKEEDEMPEEKKEDGAESSESSKKEDDGAAKDNLSNSSIRLIQKESVLSLKTRNESELIFVISTSKEESTTLKHTNSEFEEYLLILEDIKKELEENQYATVKLDEQNYFFALEVTTESLPNLHWGIPMGDAGVGYVF